MLKRMYRLWYRLGYQPYRSRRDLLLLMLIGVAFILSIYYNVHIQWQQGKVLIRYSNTHNQSNQGSPLTYIDLASSNSYITKSLNKALLKDEARGCEIPKLDPFSKELNQFHKSMPPVECTGMDWVKCYHSVCKVQRSITNTITSINCTYRDIIYDSDQEYHFGPPTTILGCGIYVLGESDHVKISCRGRHIKSGRPLAWSVNAAGIRKSVYVKPPPEGREDTYNVMIVGFDSTSKNGFIRRMPKSYDVLLKDLKAVIMNGYNIVGDGTPAALFPLLTGHGEPELPDARKCVKNNNITMDMAPFIFYQLKEDGYRTAYFEDYPTRGTFQYRFRGFTKQPTDHYMRAFFIEVERTRDKHYCIGDTPQYLIMLNLTKQVFELKGKKFCFTFISDICHDNINKIATADEDFSRFLIDLQESGILRNTALIVMSDHGPRFANVRATLQGKLEERLPFLAIKVPEAIQGALASNSHALVTAYDLHTTILDIMGLQKHKNEFKVPGSDLPRGLSLLEPIPVTRSCSEAGITPHWCSCIHWINVSRSEQVYQTAGIKLVAFINNLTKPHRSLCAPRTLRSIVWLMRQRPNEHLLSYHRGENPAGYVGKYEQENYQIRLTVGPGVGEYEATMAYNIMEDKFTLSSRDISRTNAYNDEPKCISQINSKLNLFCYCKK